jgi:predicted DNA-binding protein with PD1-like motif
MNVAESKRVRHLVLHVERGEELPVALIRALHDVEAKAAHITGVGIVEAAELASIDPRGQSATYRLDTPALVMSLAGDVAVEDGATNVHLYATLARQTDLGHQTVSGHVRWARASALDLFVTVFDDLVLERLTDDHGFPAALHATSRAPSGGSVRTTTEEPTREPIAAPVAAAPKPVVRETDLDLKLQPSAPALTPPARLPKPHEDTTEVYPDVSDLATHFSFGECEVISSDGERIRLRQIKDGRVREVSLAMLKVEGPTTDPATNKRLFKLSRKN